MRVAIDKARGDDLPAGVQFSAAALRHCSNRADVRAVQRQVANDRFGAGTVVQGAIAYDQIVHLSVSQFNSALESRNMRCGWQKKNYFKAVSGHARPMFATGGCKVQSGNRGEYLQPRKTEQWAAVLAPAIDRFS